MVTILLPDSVPEVLAIHPYRRAVFAACVRSSFRQRAQDEKD